jgi:hypothetical protein
MLALEFPGATVILDDLLARRVAESLNLHLTGTLGLLLDAKQAGLISQVRPFLDQLQTLRFRILPLSPVPLILHHSSFPPSARFRQGLDTSGKSARSILRQAQHAARPSTQPGGSAPGRLPRSGSAPAAPSAMLLGCCARARLPMISSSGGPKGGVPSANPFASTQFSTRLRIGETDHGSRGEQMFMIRYNYQEFITRSNPPQELEASHAC